MTIENPLHRAEYELHRSYGSVYSKVADKAYDAIWEIAKEYGLMMPNDDRAENLVTKIFTTVWDANH